MDGEDQLREAGTLCKVFPQSNVARRKVTSTKLDT